MPASHAATTQALKGGGSWPVSSHNVFVCPSSEPSSATVPDHKPVFASCRVLSRVSIRYKFHASYTSALVT